MGARPSIEQISERQFLEKAINPFTLDIARWVDTTRTTAVEHGIYPDKGTLAGLKITEMEWLILARLMRLLPGGGASNRVVPEAFTHQVGELPNYDPQNTRLILATHGSLIDINDGVEQTLLHSPNYGSTLNHLSHLRTETNCGGTNGTHQDTRRKLADTVAKIRETHGSQTPQMYLAEAFVGARNPAEPLNSLNAFAVHDNRRDIRVYNPSEAELKQDELPDGSDHLQPAGKLNDDIRYLMDKGYVLVGFGCVDARNTLVLPEASVAQIDINKVAETIRRERGWFSRRLIGEAYPLTGWQNVGHTEFPIAPFITDRNDQMVALAYWEMTHGLALTRANAYGRDALISPAMPLIFSLPKSLLQSGEPVVTAFVDQITKLGSNLRQMSYTGHRSLIMNGEGNIYEVEQPQPGIRVIRSHDEIGYALGQIRITRPLIHSGPMTHPNPNIVLSWPRSAREIGPYLPVDYSF